MYDVNSKDLLNSSNYPNYQYLCNEIVLIQEVGDAVFVPSGWHHQVWNIVRKMELILFIYFAIYYRSGLFLPSG